MPEELPSRSVGETLWDWLESRNYWRLLLAIPAFLGVAGVAVFAFYHFGWQSERAEAMCVEQGSRAMAAGQMQRASLAYQSRLRLRRSAEPEYLFRIAQCFGELNRRPEAAAMFSVLAPADRAGYVPAHMFLARALLSSGGASPRALELAATHLQKVLQQEAQNTDARELLGRIYLQLGRWDEARKQLIEAVAARPEAALLLAATQRELGDEPGARAWAARAVKYFSDRCEEATGDDPRARLGWANALTVLKDHEAAVAVVETGRQKSDHPSYGPALAQVCGLWATQLRTEKPTDYAGRLLALRQGLEVLPGNPVLLGELARFLRVRGPEAEATRQALTRLLAEGRQAPLLHLCLGTLAQQAGDSARTTLHFKAAYAAAPRLADLANNLASTLAEERDGDLALALAILQPVLASAPENPFYRDTRGQILLKQGEAKAAVADLEFALPKLTDKTGTHRALAEAYGKLGLTELAAENARLAAAGAASSGPAKAPVGKQP
jgi:tetratricopeptide (TPR) repeat protein